LSRFKDAKIGLRVTAGFFIIFTLMIAVSVVGIQRVNQIDANLTAINDVNSVKQRYAINFRGSVHDRAIALRDVVLVEAESEREAALAEIWRLEENYADSAKPMDEIFAHHPDIAEAERRILKSIKAIEAETLPHVERVIELQVGGRAVEARQLLLEKARPAFSEWLKRINQFIDFEEAANQRITAATREIASGFQILMIAMTAAALLVGTLFVLWTMSALRPLGRLTDGILHLAEGRLEIDIPETRSKDEVGLIAGAVKVFRDNARKIQDLQKQAEEADEKAKQERRREMHSLAENFEASVTEVVETVASSATQMQTAARGVARTADETSKSSQSVAKAAADANANAQMVASAADELSASIRDISSQTTQSLDSAREAVKRTENASRDIEQLTTAAQSIGDVIDLINDIAEQTTCWPSTPPSRRPAPGKPARGSRWSPRRSRTWPIRRPARSSRSSPR